jgi:hypothetical protein
MQKIMSANGATAWKRRRFFADTFFAGVFFAGLSALTRCDFKNPARWAGLLCRRGSALDGRDAVALACELRRV